MKRWFQKRNTRGGHARGRASRVAPPRSFRAAVGMLLLMPYLAGCYHYVPVAQAVLPVGTEVSIGLTDRGRLALAEPVGPGVRLLRGALMESTDTSYLLAVREVHYIDLDLPARWNGKPVEVSRDFVVDIRERRISRPRTILLTGILAAAAIVASTIAIRGFGADLPGDRPGGEPGQQ